MRKNIFNKAIGWRKAWRHLKQLPWQNWTPGQLTEAQNNRTIPPFSLSRKVRRLLGGARSWSLCLAIWPIQMFTSQQLCQLLWRSKKVGSSQGKLLDLKHESGKLQSYPDAKGKKAVDGRGSISCLYCHTSNCHLFLLSPSHSSPASSSRSGALTTLCLLPDLQLLRKVVLGCNIFLSLPSQEIGPKVNCLLSSPYHIFEYQRWDKGRFFLFLFCTYFFPWLSYTPRSFVPYRRDSV